MREGFGQSCEVFFLEKFLDIRFFPFFYKFWDQESSPPFQFPVLQISGNPFIILQVWTTAMDEIAKEKRYGRKVPRRSVNIVIVFTII